jgi:predicted DNA-binding ArsR family transcriptional regulator
MKKLFLMGVQSTELSAGDFKTKIAQNDKEAIISGEMEMVAGTLSNLIQKTDIIGANQIKPKDFASAVADNWHYINENVYSGLVPSVSPTGLNQFENEMLKMAGRVPEDERNLIAKVMNRFNAFWTDSPIGSVVKWLSGPAGLINAMMLNTAAVTANTVSRFPFAGIFKGIWGTLTTSFNHIRGPINALGAGLGKMFPALKSVGAGISGSAGILKNIGSVVAKLGIAVAGVFAIFQGAKQILFGPGEKSKKRFEGQGFDDDQSFRANLASGIGKMGLAALLLTPAAPLAAATLLLDALTGGWVTDTFGIVFEKMLGGLGSIIEGGWFDSLENFGHGLMNIWIMAKNHMKDQVQYYASMLGIQLNLQKEALREVENIGKKSKDETVEVQQKMHNLIWNGTEYSLAPGSQGAVKIDLSSASDILAAQKDSDQYGFTDAEILSALIDGNRVNKEMLAALQYMARRQGKDLSPAYNTNPDSKRM